MGNCCVKRRPLVRRMSTFETPEGIVHTSSINPIHPINPVNPTMSPTKSHSDVQLSGKKL